MRINITETVNGEEVYKGWFSSETAERFQSGNEVVLFTAARNWVIEVGGSHRYLKLDEAEKWMKTNGFGDLFAERLEPAQKRPVGRPSVGKRVSLLLPQEQINWCKSKSGNLSSTVRGLIQGAMDDEQ